MKILKYTFLLLVFLASTLTVIAQNALLHFDKEFYVTGEVMWYKLYLPDSDDKEVAVVQVLISDREGAVKDEFYLQASKEGHIEGYYKIPFDFASDYYRLSILATDDSEKLIVSAVLPIYNDLNKATTATGTLPVLNEAIVVDDLQVELSLNKNQYSPREAVRASVLVKDSNGKPVKAKVSVAVTDESLAGKDLLIGGTAPLNIGTNVRVKGTLLNAEGVPSRASVLGMYSSIEDRVFYSSADEEGQFDMKPPLFYGERPVQFIGYQFEHMDIGIEMKEHQMPPIEQALIYSQEVLDYLALSQKRKKIFQIYTALETQLEPEQIDYDVQDLEPIFTYVIDEYESFEYMRDFFGELITPLKFILKEDSTYRAQLYNPSGLYDANTVLSGDPLFIIDGKLTRDADFVARMDMDYIETIALMYRPENLRKKFKAIGRSGVVKMTTNLRNVNISEKDNADVFTINGLQPQADFPEFVPNSLPSGQPFFRPQLYWNPNLKTGANGKADFTFYQSDDVSNYTIRVVVQDEKGDFGKGTKTYEVKVKE